MKVNIVNTVKIYDGTEASLIPTKNIPELGSRVSLDAARLIPVEDYDWNKIGLSFDSLIKSIGADVLDFDGMKIYSGTINGTNLFVYEGDGEIYVMSYGETQPARYQLGLEAIIS